jgi:DNA-binding MarR family transcriptional regulator
MNRFARELDEAVGRMFSTLQSVIKRPMQYGCGVDIYPSDIHMIEAIKNYPASNTTDLALKLGVTKGTVSKLTKKLSQKGFVSKYQFEDNKKEVYYELTELGRKAYDGHYEYHDMRDKDMHSEYEKLSDDEKRLILRFLNMYADNLRKYT